MTKTTSRDMAFEAMLNAARGLGFVSDEAEERLRSAVETILDDPRNQEGDDKTNLASMAQDILKDERHWSIVEATDRAENGAGLAGAVLTYLGVEVTDCPDDCEDCKAHNKNTDNEDESEDGAPHQMYIETLDVDGRKIEVYRLSTGDEIDGYDIYDEVKGDALENDPLNLGDILLEHPTVESVRVWLKNKESGS